MRPKRIRDLKMKRLVLMIVPALICGMVLTGCGSELATDDNKKNELMNGELDEAVDEDVSDDVEFCLCFDNFEDMNKTIPIVNEFLANLPDEIRLNDGWTHKEQIFGSLEAWLNSFPCSVDAKILYGVDLIWGQEQMRGVAISVKDGDKIRELELDFAVIEDNGNLMVTYLQIAGYVYYKQDAIHVKTKYTKIKKVFDLINSLELDVKEIQGGTYTSNMPSNLDNLQKIVNGLKAKPYTNDAWVAGNMQGFNNQIIIYIILYDMKKQEYQADWFKTMDDYQLVERDFEKDDDHMYGPGHIVLFQIPEETGKHWETKFLEYDFVRWSEMGYSRCTIR